MHALTDLWDSKDYSESRRHRSDEEQIRLEKVQLNMLAAGPPAFLSSFLPDGAWDMGFMSRVIMIYSGEQKKVSLFADQSTDDGELDQCQDILKRIGQIYGRIEFTEEAKDMLDNFYLTGGHPIPDHPKLGTYVVRRIVHLLKLSMIASMSRSDELVIEKEDVQRALDWLLEAEIYMPDIFKAMAQGGSGKVMEDVWYYVFNTYSKEQQPVQEYRLIQFLQEKVPVHSIKPTVDMMEKSKMIEAVATATGKAYKPNTKKPGD